MEINKILICGRGYSFKFYENFKDNYNLKFSYNHFENVESFDFNFFSKNKENFADKSLEKNFLKESNLNKVYKIKSFHLGTTTLGLFTLLKFISIKYPNSEVHLVGFDHRYIYEEELESFLDINLQNFLNVESQKAISSKLQQFFDNLKIKYVGFDIYSEIDAKTSQHFEYSKKDTSVEIVAEITTNHFGDNKKLIDLMLLSKKAGADSVKFQMRDVDSFYNSDTLKMKYNSPFGNNFRDYRKALELNESQLELIREYSKELELKFFFSALDLKSYLKLKEFGLTRIKIPSTISNNLDYINFVLNDFDQELVVSTGMTDEKYLDLITQNKSKYKKLYLLHCISSYPTNIFNLNLEIIRRYSKISNKIIPGYSSHDIGYEGSMFAVFAGAKMIEKHVKLGNSDFGHFDETALDVRLEFGEYVKMLKKAEMINGIPEKRILKSEHHKY